MTTLGDVAKFASSLPKELHWAQTRGVRKGALLVTTAMRQEVKLAVGSDSRMSGVGGRGAKIGARYDVRGERNPTAIIRATGPAHLIERDTEPHEIRPRRRRGRGRATQRRALRFANGGFAASAIHPGTRGKRPFEKAYLRTRGKTGAVYDAEIQRAITKAMK